MITITSDDGSTAATYVPEANMLCASLTVDGVERLDQRKGVDAYATSGSTMAIPLLYPWANRLGARSFAVAGKRVELPDDPARIHVDATGTPIHGVTPALMPFEATQTDATTIAGRLVWADPRLLELFPFAHELELEAHVGAREITVTVTVHARDEPVPISFGFHPYLRLAEAAREEWMVELPACNALTLDGRMLPTGERVPQPRQTVSLADHAFDTAYELTSGQGRFEAATGTTTVTVELMHGYGFAQVFSPENANFICFEPMTAPGNALVSGDDLRVLEPGEQAHTTFRIRIS